MSVLGAQQLAEYQLHLSGFEGPLDVLLRLIERERLEISTVSLVQVTDQFLAYIDQMDDPTPRLIAEFATIAGRLLVLKSRALLPKPGTDHEPDDVDDLAEQLRDYQRAKQLAGELRQRDDLHWRSFMRHAPATRRDVRLRVEMPDLSRLHAAFLRAVSRQRSDPPAVAPIRRVTSVADMARRLIGAVLGSIVPRRFSDLVDVRDREEAVAGFIALLSLWSRREITVEQERLFDEILVARDESKGAR
ncbi:MAG: segregation and condensation protein A [Chloroflexota bacterium]